MNTITTGLGNISIANELMSLWLEYEEGHSIGN